MHKIVAGIEQTKIVRTGQSFCCWFLIQKSDEATQHCFELPNNI